MFRYIVYDDDTFSIFHNGIKCSNMRVMGKTPISAGAIKFNEIDDGIVVSCYGGCKELGLKSRPSNDANIIEHEYRVGSGVIRER